MIKNQFKIGDKVRRVSHLTLNGEPHVYHDMLIGKEDVVTSVCDGIIDLADYGLGHEASRFELVEDSPQPIKSDGGSSSYYTFEVNGIDKATGKPVTVIVETEDVIVGLFDNDFDAGTAFKSLVRLWRGLKGIGKAGNTSTYEGNKIKYSVNKLTGVSNRDPKS